VAERSLLGAGLEIIPLGGASEVGKSSIFVRYGNDAVLIDAGVIFPTDEHPGVDLIIPDFAYVAAHAEQLRAICITHAHEDHIGALPYLLRQVSAPVYATPLTIGIIREKLDEHGLLQTAQLRTWIPGEALELGALTVEPIRVTHSIPDTVSLAIFSPAGIVVHTGDFKIDHTPVDGKHFDAARFAQLGDEGVMLLLSDSVNAERKGWVPSERVVGNALDEQFRKAEGRVLVTTFSSNLHRVQQVFETAARYGRRVAVAGRSMERNIGVARELGYLKYADTDRVKIEEMEQLPDHKVAVITTGSQGEPLAALSRMARDDHKIKIRPGDTVVLSSKPIPGNEEDVWRTVNRLIRRGAHVVYDMITPVHVSGHANQEELKLMFNLTRPLYAAPFHGEPRMMYAYTEMVAGMGMPRERVLWLENGDRLFLDGTTAELLEPIGPAAGILVDGLSEGGVSDVILRDRRHLGSEGTVVVTVGLDRATGEIVYGPDLISRGFLHPEDSEDMFDEARTKVTEALETLAADDDDVDPDSARMVIRDVTARSLKKRTGRRPVIVPAVMEI
jgi:ribonuclease J